MAEVASANPNLLIDLVDEPYSNPVQDPSSEVKMEEARNVFFDYCEMTLTPKKKKKKSHREEEEEDLEEALRRSVEHTQGPEPPEPPEGRTTSPGKRARVRANDAASCSGAASGSRPNAEEVAVPLDKDDETGETKTDEDDYRSPITPTQPFYSQFVPDPDAQSRGGGEQDSGDKKDDEMSADEGPQDGVATPTPPEGVPLSTQINGMDNEGLVDFMMMSYSRNIEASEIRLGESIDKKLGTMESRVEALFEVNSKKLLGAVAEALEKTDKKVMDRIQTTARQTDKKMEEMGKKFDKGQSDLKDDMNKLAERVSALEKGPKAQPPLAREGLNNIGDPWADFNARTKQARPAAGAATGSGQSAATGGPSGAVFEPTCVIAKGWCRYGERKGLNANEAIALGNKLKNMLNDDLRNLVMEVDAPCIINRQVTMKIKAGPDRREDSWRVRTFLAEALKACPCSMKGRDVYVIVEPSPQARNENKIIGKATKCLENAVGADESKKVVIDFRAATAYYSEQEDQKDVNGLVAIGSE